MWYVSDRTVKDGRKRRKRRQAAEHTIVLCDIGSDEYISCGWKMLPIELAKHGVAVEEVVGLARLGQNTMAITPLSECELQVMKLLGEAHEVVRERNMDIVDPSSFWPYGLYNYAGLGGSVSIARMLLDMPKIEQGVIGSSVEAGKSCVSVCIGVSDTVLRYIRYPMRDWGRFDKIKTKYSLLHMSEKCWESFCIGWQDCNEETWGYDGPSCRLTVIEDS